MRIFELEASLICRAISRTAKATENPVSKHPPHHQKKKNHKLHNEEKALLIGHLLTNPNHISTAGQPVQDSVFSMRSTESKDAGLGSRGSHSYSLASCWQHPLWKGKSRSQFWWKQSKGAPTTSTCQTVWPRQPRCLLARSKRLPASQSLGMLSVLVSNAERGGGSGS